MFLPFNSIIGKFTLILKNLMLISQNVFSWTQICYNEGTYVIR